MMPRQRDTGARARIFTEAARGAIGTPFELRGRDLASRVDAGRFNPSGIIVIAYDNALYGYR